MIKLIIFAVLGLAVGLGGGAAASVMKARKAFGAWEAARAQVVADSILKAAEHEASDVVVTAGHGDSAATDSAGSHAAAPAPSPAPEPSSKTKHAAPSAPASHAPEPSARTPTSKAVETVVSGGATARPKPIPVPPGPVDVAANVLTEKVSRIFGAMPAKDAARVLEQLEDADVKAILTGLSDKQAAGIMQHLPANRAAAISKLVLRGGAR
ncbi:MAG: hypothetical protein IT361_00155 [Gemmatimonadaceae bacterium]|nr:hypothetical protein [Gemmatimonadaceae bacterium]